MAEVQPTQDMIFEYVSDEQFEKTWNPPAGFFGRLMAVQNQNIGIRFIATSIFFFCLAGILALLMRIQLSQPENTFLSPETYNGFFTMHGSTMMFLFLVPLIEGIATLVLPQMLGSRELPYPRLTAFAYWTFLAGGLLFYASFFFQAVPTGGWFAYVPLTGPEFSPGRGMDFWLLGLNVAEVGAIAGAIEIILAFFKMRAPGMTLNRIPIFAWAMLITAFMMIFAFTPLIVGSLLLEFDRKLGTQFYNPALGGSPLLWQHVFWIFGHPDVYIQFIPAAGMISTIIPVFSKQRLVAYPAVVLSLIATGFLSFGLWVHHMFATGLPEMSMSFFSAVSLLIAIPAAVQIFSWIATMWRGQVELKTPMLFALGFFFIFILGGITGVMVGVAPVDLQLHDSYFVVAHFHYVLFGGSIFPIFAGIYFWAPKFLSRHLNERLGQIQFWLLFIGFNVTFFPMHLSGLLGMPRRVYTYQEGLGWEPFNLVSTIGAFIIAAAILVFLFNVVYSLLNEEIAAANPWNADTLEWATKTPSYQYGFRELPIVRSRHPLWEQEDLSSGTEKEEAFVQAFARWPKDYRAQLVVSALDARPQEVIRIAGPSIWPIIASISTLFFSFFLIFDLIIPGIISGLAFLAALLIWHQTNVHKPDEPAKIAAFEKLTGVPVNGDNSRAMPRWGMGLTVAAMGIGFVTLLFIHMYLRAESSQWPPAGTAVPDPLLPGIAMALLLVGVALHYWAASGVRNQRINSIRWGLPLGSLFGLGGLTVLVLHGLQLPFTHQTNAYGSSFYVIGVSLVLAIAVGIIISLVSAFWIWLSDKSADTFAHVNEIAFYWFGITGYTLIGFAVLYLSPVFL